MNTTELSLDDDWTNCKPISVVIDGQREACSTSVSVYLHFVKTMIKEYGYDFIVLLSDSPSNMRSPHEVQDGVYVDTHGSANVMRNKIKSLCKKIKFSQNKVRVELG